MKRILLGLLLAGALAPSTAVAATPKVTAYFDGTSINVDGQARTGPLEVTLTGIRRTSLAVIELAPGHTVSELGDIAGLEDPQQVERIGRLVAGGTVEPGRPYITTITAHERNYAVVDVSGEDGSRVQFTASGPGDGSYPAADARVVIRDRSLEVPARLPRHGVIRVDNAGSQTGNALALRINPKLTTKEAIRRAVKRNQPMTAGTPINLVGLVSAGTTNRAQVHLRPGRYLVLSLVGAHAYAVTKVGAHD